MKRALYFLGMTSLVMGLALYTFVNRQMATRRAVGQPVQHVQPVRQSSVPVAQTPVINKKELARQKFIEGLRAFHDEDFQTAQQRWTEAQQLDPTNKDIELGLAKVKEMTE